MEKFVIQGEKFAPVAVGMQVFDYNNIVSATTTVVKTGAGFLKRIVINKGVVDATIKIYDNTSASAPAIGQITLPSTLELTNFGLDYDTRFSTGLTIVTNSAVDLTVVYS